MTPTPPLTAEENLRVERRSCLDCQRVASICPYHAGYEAGIRAKAIEAATLDRERAKTERLREAASEVLDIIDHATSETDDTAPLYDFLAGDAQRAVETVRAALEDHHAEP